MGVVSLIGNSLFDRLKLLVTDPDQYPLTSYVRKVRMSNIIIYSVYQMAILGVLVAVTYSPIAVVFPLIIAALPVFRRLAEHLVPTADCLILDVEEDLDDEIDTVR